MDTSAPLLGEPLPVELMNTIWADRDGVYDALDEPAAATAWLRAIAPRVGLPFVAALDGLTAVDIARIARQLTALRDALRRLAAEATDDPRPAAASVTRELRDAVGTVNRVAAVAPRWSALIWESGDTPTRVFRASDQAVATISAIADEAIHLFSGDSRLQLRACLAPGCVLYFSKDHPRREWCSSACGNRARAARHYQRHRPATT
ncbi:CGNR zinc finger domain-containing protein [Kutzneria sp. CA-103260]|uniref:CGNR zinc finger domain-containing protein n=1 Tax=Kutzneria sp. CA-103260 TaxID=2802641 RepID=UPI002013A2A7|nr:ABATE domain-containing protein [Kutzneria sp. CA-103260]